MSIASELQDLETNVAAIQQAVIDKGGTVTGGLADLATDIEDLPSGGGIDPSTTDWGVVKYYSSYEHCYAFQDSKGYDFSVDYAKFKQFLNDNGDTTYTCSSGPSLSYNNVAGIYSFSLNSWDEPMININKEYSSSEEMLAETGIWMQATPSSTYASIEGTPGWVVDQDSLTEAELLNETEYNTLCGANNKTNIATVGGVQVPFLVIKEVHLGANPRTIGNCFLYQYKATGDSVTYLDMVVLNNQITTIGNYFLARATNLRTLSGYGSVQTIGDNFLDYAFNRAGDGYHTDLDFYFPELTSAGNNFLAYQSDVVSVICPKLRTIGNDSLTLIGKRNSGAIVSLPVVETIGNNFCGSYCWLSSLDLGNKVTTIGSGFCNNCSKLPSTIKFPASLTSIAGAIFNDMGTREAITFDVGALDPSIAQGSTDYYFANNYRPQTLVTASIFRGANAQAWATKFPSRDHYRETQISTE